MGLVEYSDSESDSESVSQQPHPAQKSTPSAATTNTTSSAASSSTKKPFQRIVDRSKPGKIVVSLPGAASTSSNTTKPDEPPPPKRARVGGGVGGAFSGFNAFLPPPKNTGKPAAASGSTGVKSDSGSGQPAPRPGVNLKTGATPGFSRDNDDDDFFGDSSSSTRAAEPSIPAGQKPADEVKLVGKPMMFKPLSVSRKPAAAKGKLAAMAGAKSAKSTASAAASPASIPAEKATPASVVAETSDEPPPKRKKISLFSIPAEAKTGTDPDTKATSSGGAYEPVFANDNEMSTQEAFAQYDAQFADHHASSTSASADYQQQPLVNTQNDLDSIASDLNLSAAARRELFGRRGAPDPAQSATRVINFNTDREYAANEELRASGEAQPAFNPVRAIAPGKHNLRQLVNQVQNQKDALEESFAKGHRNRSEASAKYGWR